MQYTIPAQWFQVDETAMDQVIRGWALSQSGIDELQHRAWSVSNRVEAQDIFSAVAPQVLQIYELEREVTSAEIAGLVVEPAAISDLLLPVSQKTANDGLVVARNLVRTVKQQTIIEQELRWDYLGTTQTVLVHAVVDVETERLQLVWIRCSDTCMFENAEVVEDIQASIEYGVEQ